MTHMCVIGRICASLIGKGLNSLLHALVLVIMYMYVQSMSVYMQWYKQVHTLPYVTIHYSEVWRIKLLPYITASKESNGEHCVCTVRLYRYNQYPCMEHG